MAFNAEQRKISDILSGDFKYVIPRYQRKYVWQEKQWRELLDDIKYCLYADQNGKDVEWTHFLGSLVFEKDKKELIVIDGQQRLTTIILMLCSICVLFNEYGDRDRFKGVVKYICGTNDMGQEYIRVDNEALENFKYIVAESIDYNLLQNKNNLFAGKFLQTSPQDNVNVKNCFTFFYSQFQDMIVNVELKIDELARIRDKIVNLDVIDIRATNQQESYNIFEILNARGVDLNQHELIKNYVFKYIHPRASIDTAKLKWDMLERLLYIKNRSVMDSFFTHYISHKFEKPSKENSEFRIMKEQINRNEMVSFLDDLYEKATFYRWFYIPEECENVIIRESIQFFLDNNHRQFRPVFLSIISAYKNNRITSDFAEKFFIFIRNFYFGYGVVCDGKSNTIEDMVYKYSRRIDNENAYSVITEMIDKLTRYYPTYNQFESSFLLLGYSNKIKRYNTHSKKKEVQYILHNIERYYLSANKELLVNDFTIEHIANDDEEKEEHCYIGNLLPLAESINGNAGDKTLNEKISYYKRSDFVTVSHFIERNGNKEVWGSSDIKKRGQHMAKLAYDTLWKL